MMAVAAATRATMTAVAAATMARSPIISSTITTKATVDSRISRATLTNRTVTMTRIMALATSLSRTSMALIRTVCKKSKTFR